MPRVDVHAPNITYSIDYTGNAFGNVDPYLEAIALGAVRAEQYREGIAEATEEYRQRTQESEKLLDLNAYLGTITPENWDAKKDEAIPLLEASGLAIPSPTKTASFTTSRSDLGFQPGVVYTTKLGSEYVFDTYLDASNAMYGVGKVPPTLKPFDSFWINNDSNPSDNGHYMFLPLSGNSASPIGDEDSQNHVAPIKVDSFTAKTTSGVTDRVIDAWHKSITEKAMQISQITEQMATHLQLLIGQKELAIYFATDGNQTRGRTLHGVAENIK